MDQDQWLATSSSYTYVDTPNSNLICCICRNPYVEPTTTRTCSHTFCYDCIHYAMRTSAHCPIDRSPITLDDIVLADPIVRHLVDELFVQCPQRPDGCSYVCQRQLLASHIKESCIFIRIPCPDDTCNKEVLRKDAACNDSRCVHRLVKCERCISEVGLLELEAHKDSCSGRTDTCPFCEAEIPHSELSTHNASCPDAIISCTHSDNGCPWTGTRRSMFESHTPTCPYEAIKGFFKQNNSRMSRLTEENNRLRQRLDASEGMMEIMRHELHVVKVALGPWARPQGSYPLWSHDQSGESIGVSQDDTSSSPLPTIDHPHPSQGNSNTVASSLADIASYFPPALNDPYISDHNINSQSPPPGPSISSRPPSISPHADLNAVPQPLASARTTPVAPLNLSTTLPGALSGIRESVVTLAASHDALWRLTELAVATEAARTNEEVSAMRSVVNGLRMQVHAMMMDRNALVTGGESGDVRRSMGGAGFGVGVGGVMGGWPAANRFYPHPSNLPHPAIPPSSVTKL
ncbi:hypothetical protein EVG20_g4250 [Dentipellis fragilis]|uniref:RING-type domain-containing protein n=1 Tax=Dentipellis fragilis TaxID=205917 RepID=A0A4Y9YZ00_9AGAM|nr:hypothetical protein EVG20_g4250 [Dentipellis fragilis]